jgi:Chondroitin N-acetylgalactosaminyltransferase
VRKTFLDFNGFGGNEEQEFSNWGNEDNILRERVLRSGNTIIRAPDFSLLHMWHPKICSEYMVNFKACLQVLRRSLHFEI